MSAGDGGRYALKAFCSLLSISLHFVLIAATLACAQTAPPSTPAPIRFENIAKKAGVDFVTQNSASPNKNQPETMVAGVALFDYDGDGYLDIFFVNGAEIPSLQRTSPKYWNRLYHNNHDGTFTDVTEKAGMAGAGYGMGVAVGGSFGNWRRKFGGAILPRLHPR